MRPEASVLVGMAVILGAGCMDYQPAPSAAPAARPESGAASTATSAAPTPLAPASAKPHLPAEEARDAPPAPMGAAPYALPPAAGAAQGTPPPSSPLPAPTTPGATRAGTQVRLSAGVALPQTLPDGSVMTFSVDYEFLPGSSPGSQSRYLLVIERPQGPPGRFPVQLRARDTLMVITPWPPSEGPFRAHLEDAYGRRISDTVDLR